jgi:hypothetical protein
MGPLSAAQSSYISAASFFASVEELAVEESREAICRALSEGGVTKTRSSQSRGCNLLYADLYSLPVLLLFVTLLALTTTAVLPQVALRARASAIVHATPSETGEGFHQGLISVRL